MSSTSLITLTVSDVKQYSYCPRVVYFTYCLPLRRPTTYKMAEGKLEHEHIAELEQRRSLKAYGLAEGERQFNVNLYSKRLELSGKLDMVIETAGEVIPVDFKNTGGGVGLNHKYQLTAYALLVEDQWQKPVRRGFIYLAPQKKGQEVTITPNMRLFVKAALAKIRDMLERESMPPPTRRWARCVDCEFRNFCNDVV
ncbi:MAG: CRISPR-associated protein Cas4 [Chloroflexi bacterium]|nr:CRISPR-associated protein Cas4 [Chloroflexota bacterium]